MKNLNFYPNEAFEFHTDTIASKRINKDPLIQVRLNLLNQNIQALYNTYKENFDSNTLENLKAFGYDNQEKVDLLSMYNYKRSIIQKLKARISTTVTNRIISTCQNCTISEVSSFDHVLPKEEFAEFVVNPLNLFPSCSVCNSAKGKYWLENGKRLFLNLYLDILPEFQYLFLDVSFANNVFTTTFTVDNRNNIDIELYTIIESHYRKLNLCRRFAQGNDTVITTYQNTLRPYINDLGWDRIVEHALITIDQNRRFMGYNYWESLLQYELLFNADFRASINP